MEDSDDDIEVVAKNDCVLVNLNSEEAEVSVFGDAKPVKLEEAVFEKSSHILSKNLVPRLYLLTLITKLS